MRHVGSEPRGDWSQVGCFSDTVWNLPSSSVAFLSLVDHRPLVLPHLGSPLEDAVPVQEWQSFSPVSTLLANSLTPIARGSWEHQGRVPGAGLETDSGHCCQGQMQDRGCCERSLCMVPNYSRRAQMQGSGKFLELLG